MKKIISGWGKNIKVKSDIYLPKNNADIIKYVSSDKKLDLIARGSGRSYGDSSLYKNLISLKKMENLFLFNEDLGLLECSSNITLNEILKNIVKKGWFLNVTPGSKNITIGGAIASDVHGKNHHSDGTFCDYVTSLKIITAKGHLYVCNEKKFSDLYHSTCGGMGLTGIIVSAKIKLLKIKSNLINTETIKTKNLEQTINAFEILKNNKYLVAWVDSTSKNKSLGRSIVFTGNHSNSGNLDFTEKKRISIPKIFSGIFINNFTIKLFNKMYYFLHDSKKIYSQNIDDFFYPLDKIKNWNNFYGKNGFIQIQILIANNEIKNILIEILYFFQKNKQLSFLTTLKKMGLKNKNYLTFPEKGFTLTLDIKMNKMLPKVYEQLELMLEKYDSKVYLTKDSMMSDSFFHNSYENLIKFKKIKKRYDPKNIFKSLQSNRLGITK